MKKFFSLAIIFLTLPLLANAQAWNPSGLGFATGLPEGSISGIIINVMFWLLAMLGVLGVVGFTISGIMYLVSAGDEDMIERAKKAMMYSIIGVLVGLLGVVVIQAIDAMLNQFSSF